MFRSISAWVASALLALAIAASPAAAAGSITVFAAASLQNALDAAAAAYKTANGTDVKISYAGSLALAKQIEQGAPADLFASADLASMNYVADRKLIKPETRVNLLGNTLVVVAPKDSKLTSLDFTTDAFKAALGSGKLATGETASVPAGIYAKAALTKLGLWAQVQPALATSDNVRASLAFVARGEAVLGIVYATDAVSEPGVKVIATFPESSHDPVIYPFAITTSAPNSAEAAKFLDFLKSPAAKPFFQKQGFALL